MLSWRLSSVMCVRWALCHPMMLLPLLLCTNDLLLARESRYLNRHNGGIFTQVWGGQSRLGCDMHCNPVFMRVRRLTFSLPNPLHEWRSDIWVINTVNQRWLIHFSIHSAVHWHQQGGNWIGLSLIIQSGNLLPTDIQSALNLSSLMTMKSRIWTRIGLAARLKSHLLPHTEPRSESFQLFGCPVRFKSRQTSSLSRVCTMLQCLRSPEA